MMSWKTRMEQRRTYEEDKKRSAAVAVNDISFPALGGGAGTSGGWGEEAAAAPAKITTFADRLKQTLAAEVEARPEETTVEIPAPKFRHPQLGRRGGDFGTSRSSYEDTYYDEEPARLLPMAGAGAGSDGGWRTVEKKLVKPQTKMFEPEDHVPDDEDFPDDDYQPDEDESYKDDWKNRL